jgi:hypothetical protein
MRVLFRVARSCFWVAVVAGHAGLALVSGWVRAGEQFTGRADGVDRAALASPALAQVAAAAGLGGLLVLAGQIPGQAQPVMPGRRVFNCGPVGW